MKKLEGMQFFLKFWFMDGMQTFSLVYHWRHYRRGKPEKKLRIQVKDNISLREHLIGVAMEEEQ